MELGCELVATSLLQSVDHSLLHVHAVALHVDQSLAQATAVELLEYILVVEIFKDCDAAGQLVINLSLRNSLARLLKQAVTIPALHGFKMSGTVFFDKLYLARSSGLLLDTLGSL